MKLKIIKNRKTYKAKELQAAVDANDGYCPLCPERTEDSKCMCKKFRDQYHSGVRGTCEYGLYEVV